MREDKTNRRCPAFSPLRCAACPLLFAPHAARDQSSSAALRMDRAAAALDNGVRLDKTSANRFSTPPSTGGPVIPEDEQNPGLLLWDGAMKTAPPVLCAEDDA